MFASFANKPTESLNKYICDEYLKDIFAGYKTLKNTIAIGLVGHPLGLKRHLELYSHFKYIVIVERDPETYLALWHALAKLNLQNVVLVEGDLFETVYNLMTANRTIGLIDFDGVEAIGKNELALRALAKKANIPIIVNIGSTRGQHKEFKNWCKENSKRKTTRVNGLSYDLSRLGLDYVNSLFKNYTNDFFTYMGKSNMFMAISIRKGLK